MSRHSAPAKFRGQEVTVVAGYDRVMNDLFLQMFALDKKPGETEERVLYDSLHEPALDWTDIDTVANKLMEFGVDVPETLLEAVYLDQLFKVGNRIVWHTPHSQARV